MAGARHVEGEVLVKFKPASGMHQRAAAIALRGHALIANLGQTGWLRVSTGASPLCQHSCHHSSIRTP